MSKSRKPISYIKPQDPAFLVRLKKEAGYKEGPTVDTKREERGLDSGSDDEHDPQPVVVQLKDGDLSFEQAEKLRIEKETAEANVKADLSKPIVFQRSQGSKRASEEESSKEKSSKKKSKPAKDQKNSKKLLSFDEEDE